MADGETQDVRYEDVAIWCSVPPRLHRPASSDSRKARQPRRFRAIDSGAIR